VTGIRWSACALALVAGLCSLGAQTRRDWREEWLSYFNRQRLRVGTAPLRHSPVLTQVAQQQAEEMVRAGRPLRSPSSVAVSERLRRVGYLAYEWREHFAIPEVAPESVLGVREVMDGRFRDLGIGAAVVDGFTFYVFLFGWHQGDYFANVTAGLHDRERIAAEMLSLINAIRQRAGRPPLVPNPLLDRVSQQHAEDMLLRSYFGHRTPEGLGPADRARASGYRFGIGETLVEQRFSAEEALEAWLGSPAHRSIILDPRSREVGLGLAVGAGYEAAPGGYRVIWVQSFGGGG
jgi:uncharacterized protein YkwD